MNQATDNDGWNVFYVEALNTTVWSTEGGTVTHYNNTGEYRWSNTAEGYSGTTASLSFAKALASAK